MSHIKLAAQVAQDAQAAMEGGLTAWMESEEMQVFIRCLDALGKAIGDRNLARDVRRSDEASYKQGFIDGAMHGCTATIAEAKAGMEGA